MYLKRLLAFLCCFTLVFCLFPSSAFATGGNGNIDGGGGSMGHGTSSNFWNSGNDGVRITVVDASSGTAVSSPLDFSNRTQKTSLLHFGKVNKLQYLGGAGLSLQSGAAYSCIRPTQSMPTIVSSKGQSNIEAIKRYFCSEYACMMVAQAAGVDYERMIAGEYKLLIEPIAYFTHNGQYYCMTATEAGLYDQMSGGNLRKTMTSLTHKNLPLSMFLEFSDLGISAWTGSTTGKQNNSDIISTLGVGIVWFDEAPPEGEIEAPDVEYRVDTDVITAVTLRTDQDLTPDNPASVTFHILGTTYRVNDIVIPAGDSQVVWIKWHTPSTPQTVTITVSVSGAYTAQDTFVAKIVDLNEHIPPDPVATDTNPGYSVPTLPNETQKLTANWGVWSCYWVPVWVWCDHGEDGGHWVDEGYWEYEYTGYSASISGEMSLMPDDIVPTASGKTMKSGYGVKTEVRATLSTDAPTSHITYPQTAFSVFPEFQYTASKHLARTVNSNIGKLQTEAGIRQRSTQCLILGSLYIVGIFFCTVLRDVTADRLCITAVQINSGLHNRKLFRDPQSSQFHAALGVTQAKPQLLIGQFQLQHFLIGFSGHLMAQKFERVKARHLVQFCHCRNCFVHHRHRITFFVHVGNSFLT